MKHDSEFVIVEGLKVTYPFRSHPVLNGVFLKAKKGEFVLVVGPTGAGKTTLLLTLAGVIPSLIPAKVEGKVRLGNRNPVQEGLSGTAGFLGIVFQDPESQYVMPTVLEEVYFPAENMLLPRDEIQRRAERALELLGLTEYLLHDVDTLSTGLKQRLALASALVLDPEILLLDEPTAHVDMWTAREIYRVLGELKKMGKTLLVVEHRVELAEPLADKVVYIDREGRASVYNSIGEMVSRRSAEKLIEDGIWIPAEYISHKILEKQVRSNPVVGLQGFPTVHVRNLNVTLGGRTILADVNLNLSRGEVAVILGPNGSGKTTLLRVLAGIIRSFQGVVEVLGGPPRPNKVAFVAQVPELQFTERTVLEELAASFRAKGVKTDAALEKAREVLRARNLEHLAERVVYELSQGEKRIISFLEMDILGREVYLLDEPTFGLDLRYSLLVLERVNELAREGKTVVMVTHDSWIIPMLNATVYGLSRGRVIFRGSLSGLLRKRELWKELSFVPAKLMEKAASTAGLDNVLGKVEPRGAVRG